MRAEVHVVDSFSAHGDYGEILRWLSGFKAPPKKTFLVHGEPKAILGMQSHIEEKFAGWEVVGPEYLDSFEL